MSTWESEPMAASNNPLSVVNWSGAHASFVGDVLTITLPSGLVGTARVYPTGSGAYQDVELAGLGGVYEQDYSDQFEPSEPGTQTVTLTPKVKYLPTTCWSFGPAETLETVSVSHTYPDYMQTQTMSDSWADSKSGEEDGIFNTTYQRYISPYVVPGEEPVSWSASSAGELHLTGRPCVTFWTYEGKLHSLTDTGSSELTFVFGTQWLKLKAELDPSWTVGMPIDPGGSYSLRVKKLINDVPEYSLVSGSLSLYLDQGDGHKLWRLHANSVQEVVQEYSWTLESGGEESWPFSNFWEARFYSYFHPTLDAGCEWDASLSGTYTGWVRG